MLGFFLRSSSTDKLVAKITLPRRCCHATPSTSIGACISKDTESAAQRASRSNENYDDKKTNSDSVIIFLIFRGIKWHARSVKRASLCCRVDCTNGYVFCECFFSIKMVSVNFDRSWNEPFEKCILLTWDNFVDHSNVFRRMRSSNLLPTFEAICICVRMYLLCE